MCGGMGWMMGRMLSQPVLPLLLAGAGEVAPGVGLVTGADGGGLVTVHGLATFGWDPGDEAGRRLAAVQLVRLRAASQGQVAAAFGVDPATVWRWDKAPAVGGVGAPVPAPRGAQGAAEVAAAPVSRSAPVCCPRHNSRAARRREPPGVGPRARRTAAR